eukprot:2316272-Pleurochrysis_carterae.AAC.1
MHVHKSSHACILERPGPGARCGYLQDAAARARLLHGSRRLRLPARARTQHTCMHESPRTATATTRFLARMLMLMLLSMPILMQSSVSTCPTVAVSASAKRPCERRFFTGVCVDVDMDGQAGMDICAHVYVRTGASVDTDVKDSFLACMNACTV